MRKLICSVFFVLLPTASVGQNAPYPLGFWRTQMHGALVEIRNCAPSSPCGFLSWVDPSISHGTTKDVRNPNAAMRSRPLIGIAIIWGLQRSGAGWKGGQVYNPETGQTFRSSMQSLSNRKLKVTGCWGPLCRSEVWVKVDNHR